MLFNFKKTLLGETVISLSFPMGSSALKMVSGEEFSSIKSRFIDESRKKL